MTRFIEQMDRSFHGDPQTLTDFSPKQLMDQQAYRGLLGEYFQKTGTPPVQTMERDAYGNYKTIKYHVYANGLIVIEYQKIGKDQQVYYEVVKGIHSGRT